jgi:putative endonuclease
MPHPSSWARCQRWRRAPRALRRLVQSARRPSRAAPAIREGADAWVYVLRCRDGSLYTGWSNDIDRRLARHREGRASRYTASRLPVELVLALPMADRSTAMREEARIKALDREAKLALIAGHSAARR